jgi:hypothetical protein
MIPKCHPKGAFLGGCRALVGSHYGVRHGGCVAARLSGCPVSTVAAKCPVAGGLIAPAPSLMGQLCLAQELWLEVW